MLNRCQTHIHNQEIGTGGRAVKHPDNQGMLFNVLGFFLRHFETLVNYLQTED
jgi:hypothetical protein